MRKVTTINLNNNVYQIDEDGYEALRQYLENAERALANNPDRAEIMADLEQAIADKCRMALGQYKTVVSAAEIERILKEMGPVVGSNEDAAAPADAASTTTGATTSTPNAGSRPRRLYRILDGRHWTGVCNGLAAFASVDVSWVRVAFVLLTVFTGGFWAIVYFVLIFVMPVAETPEELASAHGQPFNAQELVDRAKKKHEDFRAERRARREQRRANRNNHWFAPLAATAPAGPPPGPAARAAGGVMLPVFTLLSAGWFAAMAVVAFMVWHGYQLAGLPWPHDGSLSDLPRWLPLLALFALYMLLALPIAAGRRMALYYANGGDRHGWADTWSGLLWLAVVALLLLAAMTALPQLQEWLHNLSGWPRPGWHGHWL